MDERLERQALSKRLQSGLLSLGLDCGIPLVNRGDDFVLPKNNSPRMNLVRYFVSAMIAPEGESSVVAVPVTPPRVRNRFIVQKRHGLRRRVFVEITDAPPRSDGTARVQFRAVNIRGKGDERLGFHLQTLAMGSRIVYESEIEAQKKLESLIESSEYELYVVTGMLSVVGKSGTLYVIRKSRPTLAFAQGEKMKPLCALCMHPLGYFASSWIGAMPPTDEVVAHLLMIRGDEHYFWRKANQIPFSEPNSGV